MPGPKGTKRPTDVVGNAVRVMQILIGEAEDEAEPEVVKEEHPLARLDTITIAEDVLRLLRRSTHDPSMFIKPGVLRVALQGAGLVPGALTGLGPRGLNRRLDLTVGPQPLIARKLSLPAEAVA